MTNFNSIPEILRKDSIDSLFNANTFNTAWQHWKNEIQNIIGTNYTELDLINLGDHLSEIFKSTGGSGRAQSSLSGGGAAWESLVCWYINLCCVGSRIVAVKKMSLVPSPIQDAITVNYGNFACNTESDITVIIFPDKPQYTNNLDSNTLYSDGNESIAALKRGKLNYDYLNKITQLDFDDFEIGVIQCKTNWNDNAQIPMLWDMIYSANGFRGRNITIGKNGFNIHQTKNFTYSFVTVPSNQNAIYKDTSVSVKRVTNLSGGNYWGNPTEQHIARSLKEIFTNNYNSGYNSNIRTDIRNCLPNLGSDLSYFQLT
ncbi:MAG: hypothetical protein R8N23_04500 [Reichenbachiella sp.]|uniref:hypothetical protein n=1 Tax=Reichenbachiella sp. TaxID=2184521 RepID=UPI002966764F|nr:hypothetical protein [Reichenbachiella sp.]MDW3209102.1 hypothetical protein [Reichenbachiella sp.]